MLSVVTRVTSLLVIAVGAVVAQGPTATPGVLLLAHGGSPDWNARVSELAGRVDVVRPTEVAFGMAARPTIQSAVNRLVARGATEIIAVPLFVSSWSPIVTSTAYLLGLRAEAPAELAAFARMRHAPPAGTAAGSVAVESGHVGTTGDPASPVTSPVPIRMTPALDDHPVVAEILAARARSISVEARREALIIVAHGPNDDEDNRRWLQDMASVIRRLGRLEPFGSVDYLTLRDDAEEETREQATAELRRVVSRRADEGRRVLIVPLLISFGGVEGRLRDRLEGLTYSMPDAGLAPDDRLVTWVLAMAEAR